MNFKHFLPACLLLTAVACKRGQEDIKPVPDKQAPTVAVKLNFSGDIMTSESPLGRKAGAPTTQAKGFGDSTLFVIGITRNGSNYAQGIFSNVDSITMNIPTTGNIVVTATAFNKGSGQGLYYTLDQGKKYFPGDINGLLNNRMDTVPWYTRPFDTLSYLPLMSVNKKLSYERNRFPELETYRGTASFNGSIASTSLTVDMRRCIFGVKYNVSNFTGGTLSVDYDYSEISSRSLTPAENNKQQYTYTADEFKGSDSLQRNVSLNIRWNKPDGNFVLIGPKSINFKRNTLTTVNITLPVNGSKGITPFTSDTTWTRTDNVNIQ